MCVRDVVMMNHMNSFILCIQHLCVSSLRRSSLLGKRRSVLWSHDSQRQVSSSVYSSSRMRVCTLFSRHFAPHLQYFIFSHILFCFVVDCVDSQVFCQLTPFLIDLDNILRSLE